MGFYLTTPIKDKATTSSKTAKLSFVASSMQGSYFLTNCRNKIKDGGQVWKIPILQN